MSNTQVRSGQRGDDAGGSTVKFQLKSTAGHVGLKKNMAELSIQRQEGQQEGQTIRYKSAKTGIWENMPAGEGAGGEGLKVAGAKAGAVAENQAQDEIMKEEDMHFRVAYLGYMTVPPEQLPAVMGRIAKLAMRFNETNGISGHLTWDAKGQMIQILDGPRNIVEPLYGRIQRDRRVHIKRLFSNDQIVPSHKGVNRPIWTIEQPSYQFHHADLSKVLSPVQGLEDVFDAIDPKAADSVNNPAFYVEEAEKLFMKAFVVAGPGLGMVDETLPARRKPRPTGQNRAKANRSRVERPANERGGAADADKDEPKAKQNNQYFGYFLLGRKK